MPLKRLNAFTACDDHAHAVVVYFLAQSGFYFLHILGQWYHHAYMFGFYSDSGAYLLESSCSGRVLSAGHAGGEVIADEYDHVGFAVHAVEQSCYAGVCEGGVTYDGYRRVLSGVGSTFGHCDGGSHLYAGVYGVEG